MDLQQIINHWQNKNIVTEDELILALESFSVLFAYHSGAIENDKITYHDTKEIFENGKVVSFTGDLRTLYEIQNQKICADYIIENIFARKPITIDFIKKINRLLCKNTLDERRYSINNERAGEFKKHDYVVGKSEAGSFVEDVESDMNDLIEELTSMPNADIITAAAYLHCSFENIHPFSDGNGRTGRALLNYYLLIRGYPPLIIYEEDRNQYYSALSIYDECEDIAPMKEFIVFSLIKTWGKATERGRKEKKGLAEL